VLKKDSKIYIAGHKGLVGSAVLKLLKKKGYKNLFFKKSKELDLRKQADTFNYLRKIKPEFVIICAARVGGIKANKIRRAEFIYDNLSIQNNLIHGSFMANVKNLIFLGSSCIYPRLAKQPLKENSILSGYLEHTNEPYAIAKIAGLKLCENYNFQYKTNYKCIMPSNIYGPGDNYNLDDSHFLPAIIKKIYLSKLKKKKKIYFWGTGKARREVTYVEDISAAILFFLKKKTKESLINIGSGYENTIRGYINLILKRMKYRAKVVFDNNKKLDGTPRKILDCTIAHRHGFCTRFKFLEGFDLTLRDFLINKEKNLQR
jgi:GDP-L-fucose synthase